MKKNLVKLSLLGVVFLPVVTLAAGEAFTTVNSLIGQFAGIVSKLIPLAFGIGILGFFWGLAKYIFAQGSEESKVEGKNVMLWALVALFVMAAVWGIIQLAQTTLGIQDVTPTIKTINIPGQTN